MKFSVYISACLLFICTFTTNNLFAESINYQTPFEKAQWQFSGDPFGCKINHRVHHFGTFGLMANPGEALTLSLSADWLSLDNIQSQAAVVPPSWQAQIQQPIATTSLNWSGAQALTQHDTNPFLEALEQGLTWQVDIATEGSGYRVSSSPVSTQTVANQFRICRQQLLPKPFSYLRRLELQFASSSSLLSPAHEQDLYAIQRYLQADPSIIEVLIDGHADASGERLANLVLSKARADEVKSRLIELGVAPQIIQTRHHGNRAPVASNTDSAGRKLNRRVSVRLVKSATPPAKNSAWGALK
ncbi:OmpA family protein [Shewanella abyssi]|uniref:MotY family protein n=1 Tax=Shewanella abyssi TaxID=311789 RepID=UPI00200DEA67|nr:OmpA family protein [Shewanella abyssi]MCL1050900.1 OmpA family protein [Shewanella abyssi]